MPPSGNWFSLTRYTTSGHWDFKAPDTHTERERERGKEEKGSRAKTKKPKQEKKEKGKQERSHIQLEKVAAVPLQGAGVQQGDPAGFAS